MSQTYELPIADRRTTPLIIWAAVLLLFALSFRFESIGIVLWCASIALLLDAALVVYRARGLRCTLEVPLAGNVGTALNIRVRLVAASNAAVTPRVGLAAADQVPQPGWLQTSGEIADAPITPSHRGRFDQLRVSATHRGVFGLDVIRHDFIYHGPPALSVGPQLVSHRGLRPERTNAPVRSDDDLSPISAAEPILRPWQLGDRTSSIDWRRLERLDELVVRSSPRVHDDVIIVCDLGDEDTSFEEADRLAGQWASLARHHLTRGRVALVWREQQATHVRVVENDDDIAWVLAGATSGPFDGDVLTKLGIGRTSD